MANGQDQATGLVQSPFTITKSSDGSTALAADTADTSTFFDILVYSVPLGQAVKIEPFHYFFGFLYGTGGTTAGDKITSGESRLLKANSTRDEVRTIWQGSNQIFKDVGDELQRPKLRVPVILSASQKLVWQTKSLGTTLDKDNYDVNIECFQIYEQV